MKNKKVSFIAHETKDPVSGHLMMPDRAKAVLVLGHGAGAGMYHANMQGISDQLAAVGIGTFRYQFPFMERGGGRDSQAVSLATVINAVKQAKRLTRKPVLAGGHSFGGRMTSLAASESNFPAAVIGFVFFGFPLHAPNKPSDDRATHLKDIGKPMLFLTGTRDALNSLDLFKPIVKKIKHAKLHLLDTANHGYKILKRSRQSDEDVFAEMARVTDDWYGSLDAS